MDTPSNNSLRLFIQLVAMVLKQWAGKSSTSLFKEKLTGEEFFDWSIAFIQ